MTGPSPRGPPAHGPVLVVPVVAATKPLPPPIGYAASLMPASGLVPLLGLKIVMLAGIVSLMPGDRLDAVQWLAVGLSVADAIAASSYTPPLPSITPAP